jgi:hypothetical protein
MAVLTQSGAIAREAVTHYEVIRSYGQISYLKLNLETGRTHQIRVHMSHTGHPLLGDEVYGNAVAGVLGNKYYISMQDANEQYHLFVYDTKKGMWHREDDTQAICFCNSRGDLYYIDYSDKQIKSVRGTGTLESTPVKWTAITGIIGTDSPDKKYVSRMDVRMSLNAGTRVSFYAEYDSSGDWEYLFTMDGVTLRTFAVPIRPQRCDHMRLKIVGEGDAKIFSICKTTEWGSDV